MARKDITDRQVLEAVQDSWKVQRERDPLQFLIARHLQPKKVCLRAIERAVDRGLLEYGTSILGCWLTEKGEQELAKGAIYGP